MKIGPRLRVLLVEDNRIYWEAFAENLRQHCPTLLIDEAESGDEARQKVKMTSPHLIFKDIQMPWMNGLQLTRKIKGANPNTRIAILTSYDLPEYREAALQCGADRFFVKSSLQWDEVVAFAKSIPVAG